MKEATGTVTAEMLLETAEAIRRRPREVCTHVVHPNARYRPGWYVCVSCGVPVHVTMPLVEAWT